MQLRDYRSEEFLASKRSIPHADDRHDSRSGRDDAESRMPHVHVRRTGACMGRARGAAARAARRIQPHSQQYM